MYTRDGFHLQITALKNSHFEFLPAMSQFLPVFRRMTQVHEFKNNSSVEGSSNNISLPTLDPIVFVLSASGSR